MARRRPDDDRRQGHLTLLDIAEHRETGTHYSIIHEYPMTLAAAQRILADKTRHIHPATHGDRDWHRLIPYLHRKPVM